MTKVPDATGQLRELVEELAAARRALADMKEKLKPYQLAEDAAESALFDALENASMRSVRHKDLGLFTLSDLAEPRIEDPIAFVAWADKAAPELLTANRQRLAVVVREVLRGERPAITDTAEGLPPGVAYSTRRTIGWRQS